MSNFLCDLPWVHFSIFPHGTTSVCCEADHTGSIGHGYNLDDRKHKHLLGIKDNSIDQIVNSDSYKSIRRDMLAGKVPAACKGCKRIEDAGGRSKRIKDSYWKEDWASVTQPDGTIKPNIRSVELRLGNYCNLKCRSCNAESSTSWIKEYNILKNQLPLASNYDDISSKPMYSFDWPESDEFYNKLSDYADTIEELHISGGEPFLVPKHFKLIELLKEKGKTDISIGYHTNLTYDIDKIKPNLDILNGFTNVRLNCSIDDVGDRNSYIRNPAKWKESIHNLKRLSTEFTNIKVLVCQTVNVYNFMYIEQLHKFFSDNNIELYHYYNHVHSPEYQTAYVIPSDVRKQKLDSIQNQLPAAMFNDLYGRYYNDMNYDFARKTFIKFTEALDKTRREDWKTVFPELYDIIQNAN